MLRAGCLAGELGVAPVSHRRCVTWQIGERGPLAGVGALGCRRGGARLCGWLRRRPCVRGRHYHGLHHRRSGTGSGGAVEHAGIVEKPAANCREEHHDGAEQRDNYPVAPLSLGWLRLRLVVLLLGGNGDRLWPPVLGARSLLLRQVLRLRFLQALWLESGRRRLGLVPTHRLELRRLRVGRGGGGGVWRIRVSHVGSLTSRWTRGRAFSYILERAAHPGGEFVLAQARGDGERRGMAATCRRQAKLTTLDTMTNRLGGDRA